MQLRLRDARVVERAAAVTEQLAHERDAGGMLLGTAVEFVRELEQRPAHRPDAIEQQWYLATVDVGRPRCCRNGLAKLAREHSVTLCGDATCYAPRLHEWVFIEMPVVSCHGCLLLPASIPGAQLDEKRAHRRLQSRCKTATAR